ncbi:MAG: hypothetical protein R3F39_06725 [Myxococcota bacterium]
MAGDTHEVQSVDARIADGPDGALAEDTAASDTLSDADHLAPDVTEAGDEADVLDEQAADSDATPDAAPDPEPDTAEDTPEPPDANTVAEPDPDVATGPDCDRRTPAGPRRRDCRRGVRAGRDHQADAVAEPEPDVEADLSPTSPASPTWNPTLLTPSPNTVAEPEPDVRPEPDIAEPDIADADNADGDGGPLVAIWWPLFGGVVSADAVSTTEVLLTWDAAGDDVSWPADIVYEVCISRSRGEGGLRALGRRRRERGWRRRATRPEGLERTRGISSWSGLAMRRGIWTQTSSRPRRSRPGTMRRRP